MSVSWTGTILICVFNVDYSYFDFDVHASCVADIILLHMYNKWYQYSATIVYESLEMDSKKVNSQ